MQPNLAGLPSLERGYFREFCRHSDLVNRTLIPVVRLYPGVQ